MVLSVAAFASSPEQKDAIIASDRMRHIALEICYAVPGFRKADLSTKNVVYDMVLEALKRGE